MPLLQMPDGRLCLPVTAFFGYSTEIARVAASSMRDEGHILREWLAFLAARGHDWRSPSDDLMRAWRTDQLDAPQSNAGLGSRTGRRRPGPSRIERKLAVVFTFYELLPSAFGFDDGLRAQPAFVRDAASAPVVGAMITAKAVRTKDGTTFLRWAGSQPVAKGRIPRPTPSAVAVKSILRQLRTGRDAKPSRRPTAWVTEEQRLKQERDWLIGCVAAKAGLRREEIAALRLDALAEPIRAAVVIDWPTPPPGMQPLDSLTADPALRNEVISRLRASSATRGPNLWVRVRGKGGKLRRAPFPLELVEQLLDVGLTVRRRQVLHWSARDRSYQPPENLFLSHKTRRGIGAGSIGDILKKAFRDTKETGSGHRLRAHFGMELALRLARERTDWNGGRYDTGIRDWVIARVAVAMGHESTHTTVKYYVQLAEMEVLLSADALARGPIRAFLEKAKASAPQVDPADLTMVGRLLDLLRGADAGSELSKTLECLVLDFDPAVPTSAD